MPRLQIMDRVRRVFLDQSPRPIPSEQPRPKRPKHHKSESALRLMQPWGEGTTQQSVPVVVAGQLRRASTDALTSPPKPARRPSTPRDEPLVPSAPVFKPMHLSRRMRTTAVEIVTMPCTPSEQQPEPKGEIPGQDLGSLLHLIEQQSSFMDEQQKIISQLIQHLERMDMLLRSQQSTMVQQKPLPTPPSPLPAETKDATTSTSTPTRTPTPPHSYDPLGATNFRSVSGPQSEYPPHIVATTPRSSYGPPICLQSDESAAALDRIAEEIADTYDALSICSQNAAAGPCNRTSFDGPSTEFRHSAYTTITPPSDISGSPTSTPHHVLRTSDFSTLNRIHHVYRVAPLKHSRSAADVERMRIPGLGCEPESPVLPSSTGELTPPVTPAVGPGVVGYGRPSPVAQMNGRGDGACGQWYQAPDGRIYCRTSGAGTGLHEGGYI